MGNNPSKTKAASKFSNPAKRFKSEGVAPGGIPEGKPQCKEPFHTGGHHSTRLQACESSLHDIHYVCLDCHKKAQHFLTTQQRFVEEYGAFAFLCPGCATEVVDTHGLSHDSCTCPFVKSEGKTAWFCFDCRHTHLWQAANSKTEWEAYKYGDRMSFLESQDRWRGVVPHDNLKTLCPKCRTVFSEYDLEKERAAVNACLVCEGCHVSPRIGEEANKGKQKEKRDSKIQDSLMPDSAAPTAAFSLPDWTGQITGRRRRAVAEDEDIAPDEVPEISNRDNIASLDRHHIKDDTITAQLDRLSGTYQEPTPISTLGLPPTSTHRPREWTFPRHPAQTPHDSQYRPHPRPPRRYTVEELERMSECARGQRIQYEEYSSCWNCGETGHSWVECRTRDRMSGLEDEVGKAYRRRERGL